MFKRLIHYIQNNPIESLVIPKQRWEFRTIQNRDSMGTSGPSHGGMLVCEAIEMVGISRKHGPEKSALHRVGTINLGSCCMAID